MDESDLISAAEAARILGVSREAIRQREQSGSLVPAQVDYHGGQRRPRYRRADVEALRRQPPPDNV